MFAVKVRNNSKYATKCILNKIELDTAFQLGT